MFALVSAATWCIPVSAVKVAAPPMFKLVFAPCDTPPAFVVTCNWPPTSTSPKVNAVADFKVKSNTGIGLAVDVEAPSVMLRKVKVPAVEVKVVFAPKVIASP